MVADLLAWSRKTDIEVKGHIASVLRDGAGHEVCHVNEKSASKNWVASCRRICFLDSRRKADAQLVRVETVNAGSDTG